MDDFSEESFVMVEDQQENQVLSFNYGIDVLPILDEDYFGNLETPKETPTDIAEVNISDIVETHTESPTAIADSPKKTVIGESSETTANSTENPSIPIEEPSRESQVSSISFGMKPARKMKLAIEALADSEFNLEGLARIDMDDKGFKITVNNPHSHATGYLWLEPPGDFKCQKSVQDKEINLAVFSDSLKAVDDEDTITFDLLEGSTVLAVRFGRPPTEGFITVELHEPTVHRDRTFKKGIYCEASLRGNDLRKIIQAYQQEQPQQVVAILGDEFTVYFIPEIKKAWGIVSDDKLFFSREISAGEEYTAEFTFPHERSLLKASLLITDFIALLTILRVPPKYIMLRFPLCRQGYLAYIWQAKRVHLEIGVSP